MIQKFCTFFFLTYSLFISPGCIVAKKEQSSFKVKEAYYQSWIKSENEKGTNIVIELINVEPGVEFDSIVFRGNMLPVFDSIKDNSIILKSILNVGIARITIESKPVSIADQLVYRYKGKKFSFPIKSFQRKETKYLN